jgi:hypothetical protein
MLSAAVRELESKFASTKKLESALKLVTEHFSDPHMGEGIAVLERISEEFRNEKIFTVLNSTQMIPELDRVIRLTTDKETLINTSEQVLKLAQTGNAKGLVLLIKKLSGS